jgi:hypothetical protein
MLMCRGEAASVPFLCADCQQTQPFHDVSAFLLTRAYGVKSTSAECTSRSGRVTSNPESTYFWTSTDKRARDHEAMAGLLAEKRVLRYAKNGYRIPK